jgi:3'(2'), 5'-bisphosphate nucleotidase
MDSNALPLLRRIAEAAGAEIMAIYRGDFTHSRKADDSPVTEADLRADALIRRELGVAFPGVPVWSEESDGSPEHEAPSAASEGFFLVDPLDGTKEFLQRNGEFTVNIAWIEAGQARLGMVHAPALGTTWWGGPGLGAWRGEADGGAPQAIRVRPGRLQAMLRVLASRSHADGRLQDWLQGLGRPMEVVHAGSSLKFCRIAEGQADLYPRFGPTSQWDTAAGQAVLEGAGGCVAAMDGSPLRYGRELPVINPSFVAARDDALWRPADDALAASPSSLPSPSPAAAVAAGRG